MKKRFALFFLGFFLVQTALAARYHSPKYKGYHLDWCEHFETNCGKNAADAFCRLKGKLRSTGFQKWAHPGVKTMTIGQNSICNPNYHQCDTFRYIDCLGPTTRTFFSPRHHSYRLDWCKRFENECGKMAANTFCQKHGYHHAIQFVKDYNVQVPTMTIGDNAVCNPSYHHCDSFRRITCRK